MTNFRRKNTVGPPQTGAPNGYSVDTDYRARRAADRADCRAALEQVRSCGDLPRLGVRVPLPACHETVVRVDAGVGRLAMQDVADGAIADAGLLRDFVQHALVAHPLQPDNQDFKITHAAHTDSKLPVQSSAMSEISHFPTDGSGGTIAPMIEKVETPPERGVLVANLAALKSEGMGPQSVNAIHKMTGLSRATIRAIQQGKSSPGIDVLGLIAATYGLRAWHLLMPDLVAHLTKADAVYGNLLDGLARSVNLHSRAVNGKSKPKKRATRDGARVHFDSEAAAGSPKKRSRH